MPTLPAAVRLSLGGTLSRHDVQRSLQLVANALGQRSGPDGHAL